MQHNNLISSPATNKLAIVECVRLHSFKNSLWKRTSEIYKKRKKKKNHIFGAACVIHLLKLRCVTDSQTHPRLGRYHPIQCIKIS